MLIKEKPSFGHVALPAQKEIEKELEIITKAAKSWDECRDCDHFYYLIIFISRCISGESFFTKLGSVCVCGLKTNSRGITFTFEAAFPLFEQAMCERWVRALRSEKSRRRRFSNGALHAAGLCSSQS